MSRKMIEYEVEEGKITSIDGYSVGGDEITGQTLLDNINQTAEKGVSYNLDNTGKMYPRIKGRYTLLSNKYLNTNIIPRVPAGTYRVGNRISLGTAKFNSSQFVLSTYAESSMYPRPTETVPDTEPIWMVTVEPSNDYGYEFYVLLVCIRAGTLTQEKTYDTSGIMFKGIVAREY